MTKDGSKQEIASSTKLSKKGELGISKAVEIRAAADAVYRVVSTADGLHGWWAKNLTVEDRPEFRV